jgi:hypothetical protein
MFRETATNGDAMKTVRDARPCDGGAAMVMP